MKDAAAKARVKTMKALMQKLFWVTRISIILGSALIVAAVFSEKSSTAPMCIAASYFFYGMGVSILIINAVSTLGRCVLQRARRERTGAHAGTPALGAPCVRACNAHTYRLGLADFTVTPR